MIALPLLWSIADYYDGPTVSVGWWVGLFVLLVGVALIFWLLYWLLGKLAPPEPWGKVLNVLLALFVVVFLIFIIIVVSGHLMGHPVIQW